MSSTVLLVDDNQELLALLSAVLQKSGYSVIPATKGRQAVELFKQHRPKIAILDVLLPDMMGYQLAEQLRKEQADLPLIFMSGVFRGGRHGLEAKEKFQSVEYFEKPFDAQKLVAALRSLLPPGTVEEEKPDEAIEVELDIDVEEDQPQESLELTGRIRVSGGGNLSAEIRGDNLTAQGMGHTPPVDPRPPPADFPTQPLQSFLSQPGGHRGELKDNLPSLVAAFWQSRETGELGVQRGKVKKVVYFEKGVPVYALSNLLADRFGQFLVRVGKVKAEQLADATTVAAATKRRTGDVLVERGLLKDTERLYFVGQQVKSIIYSIFAWEEGVYQMSFRERAVQESIKLDLHPANLIFRGIKKLYKPERMRRLVKLEDRFLPSLQPTFQLTDIELERWEAELLPRIDGTRTVAELGALTGRPEPILLGTLCGLLALKVIERRN